MEEKMYQVFQKVNSPQSVPFANLVLFLMI